MDRPWPGRHSGTAPSLPRLAPRRRSPPPPDFNRSLIVFIPIPSLRPSKSGLSPSPTPATNSPPRLSTPPSRADRRLRCPPSSAGLHAQSRHAHEVFDALAPTHAAGFWRARPQPLCCQGSYSEIVFAGEVTSQGFTIYCGILRYLPRLPSLLIGRLTLSLAVRRRRLQTTSWRPSSSLSPVSALSCRSLLCCRSPLVYMYVRQHLWWRATALTPALIFDAGFTNATGHRHWQSLASLVTSVSRSALGPTRHSWTSPSVNAPSVAPLSALPPPTWRTG